MHIGKNARFSKVATLFALSLCVLVLLFMRGMFTTSIFAPKDPPTICLKKLLVASIEAAKRGGDMVRKVKEEQNMQVESKGETLEGVMDPVTRGDMLSHEQMYYSLLKMWPDLHIVSEEKSSQVPDNDKIKPIDLNTDEITQKLVSTLHKDVRMQDVTVWIDPLDATKEYTENLLEYVTTMVCVAHKGEPVIGVIHRPFQKQTIWAWKGRGRSDIPDYKTNIKDIDSGKMKIIVSLSHAGKVKELANKAFGESTTEIVTAGGAGYKALSVAQRKVHAYIHATGIKKWDICAGDALLRTLGGEMTNFLGHKIDYSYPFESRRNIKLTIGLLATFKDHMSILQKLKKVI